jgi:hypothetical protein
MTSYTQSYTKTCPCGVTFHYEGHGNHRKFCPACVKENERLNNVKQYRVRKQKDYVKRRTGDYKTPNGYTPFVVVKHDDPTGFKRGAAFTGMELKFMVQEGYVDGMVVKNKNKVFEIRKCRMVEVKG